MYNDLTVNAYCYYPLLLTDVRKDGSRKEFVFNIRKTFEGLLFLLVIRLVCSCKRLIFTLLKRCLLWMRTAKCKNTVKNSIVNEVVSLNEICFYSIMKVSFSLHQPPSPKPPLFVKKSSPELYCYQQIGKFLTS